jgi:hypothetical protein
MKCIYSNPSLSVATDVVTNSVIKCMGKHLPNAEKLCIDKCGQLFTRPLWRLAASDTPKHCVNVQHLKMYLY